MNVALKSSACVVLLQMLVFAQAESRPAIEFQSLHGNWTLDETRIAVPLRTSSRTHSPFAATS